MAVDTNATKAPIHPYLLPAKNRNAKNGDFLAVLPKANSEIMSGNDHKNKKVNHGIKKEPPPFVATIRGKRQILPVPTAIPSVEIINAHLEEKNSF
jgi:hypothetical protein